MNEKKEIFTYSIDQIDRAVDLLKQQMLDCAIFTFTGLLGVGKTTLIRKFLHACGVKNAVTSPTFTYINVYSALQGKKFYHFDFYRMVSRDDFFEQGFNEYLYQPDSWTCIEWPELLDPTLEDRVCRIELEYGDTADKRVLTLTKR